MKSYIEDFLQLIVSPQEALSRASQQQGLTASFIFVAVMAVLSALLLALVTLLADGFVPALSALVLSVVTLPVKALLTWLGLGTVFFIVWKIVGSSQGYHLSLCVAARLFALLPFWVLAEMVGPYAQLLVIAWAAILLIIASEQLHHVVRWKAVLIFAVLALIAGRQVFCACCETDKSRQSVVANESIALQPADNAVTVPGERIAQETSPSEDVAAIVESISSDAQTDAQTEGAIDERFGLSPEELGYKLGDMVREISESVAVVSEEFKRGLDNAATESVGNEQQDESSSALNRSSDAGDATNNDPAPANESVDEVSPAPALTPAQLGELLGHFIRDLQGVAQEMEQGYSDALNEVPAAGPAQQAPASAAEQAAETAGRSLGEFVRAFNDAVNELDAAENAN